MSLKIGSESAFERKYYNKFRKLAAGFGELVNYSHDVAARDIGLNFVSPKSDGSEIVEPSLVWFQLKGRQSSTLSEADFDDSKDIRVRVRTRDLMHWHVSPERIYLVVYVEAKEEFFVVDIKDYVKENFGDEILQATEQTKTVRISKRSVLDAQSFRLIQYRCSVAAWRDKLVAGDEYADFFFRDAELVRRLSETADRNTHMILILIKRQLFLRNEAYFIEMPNSADGEPRIVHEHWQAVIPENLSETFPYIDFHAVEESHLYDPPKEQELLWPPLELPNGDLVHPEFCHQHIKYRMKVSLNHIGRAWAQTLQMMEENGFIQVSDDLPSGVTVAPWHERDV